MIPAHPPQDAITAPWWEATRDRRLLLQACRRCGAVQHPPRLVCRSCGDGALAWREARGSGSLDAFTIVHRAPAPGFEPPYVLARVRLAEGPLLLTNVIDVTNAALVCGQSVFLDWRALDDGRHLPVFRPQRR